MGESDLYFGYDIAYLRLVSDGGGYAMHVPSAQIYYSDVQQDKQEAETGERQEPGAPRETPAPDSSNHSIEDIKYQIMGEQPGTTSERAIRWSNVASMLFTVKNDLYNQTVDLQGKWESPEAKEAFLHKVGRTLAHIQVWREAAEDNSTALHNLAAEMSIAQSKMEALWREYRNELYDSAEAHLAATPMKSLKGEARELFIRANMEKDNLTEVGRTKDRYNQKARELASETANAYAPILQKLQGARAKMMEPLNAVMRPNGPTFALPGAPGGAPPAVPAMGTFKAPLPGGGGGAPAWTGGDGMPGAQAMPTAAPNTPAVPTAPVAPTPPALTPPAIPPVAPGRTSIPTAGPPAVPGIAPVAPGAAPNAPGITPALLSGVPGLLGAGPLAAPSAPGAPGAGLPGGGPPAPPSGMATALSRTTSAFPPGTIMPPPAGAVPAKSQQQRPQGKTLGVPGGPGDGVPAVPPGAGAPGGQAKDPAAPSAGGGVVPLEQQDAFQAPPPTTAPVLDNARHARRRGRRGVTDPAATAGTTTPGAVPPLLANPRTSGQTHNPPTVAPRREAREQTPSRSEFVAGVPTGTAPVFEGRLAPPRTDVDAMAADVPGPLRGPTPAVAAEHDRYAQPQVQADRAARAVAPAHHGTEQTVWNVDTPGGPVVSTGHQEPEYRPQPTTAINSRT